VPKSNITIEVVQRAIKKIKDE